LAVGAFISGATAAMRSPSTRISPRGRSPRLRSIVTMAAPFTRMRFISMLPPLFDVERYSVWSGIVGRGVAEPTFDGRWQTTGVKGLGEIGIVGVAAAIANAVYHATGKRVRDLPITLDKLRL